MSVNWDDFTPANKQQGGINWDEYKVVKPLRPLKSGINGSTPSDWLHAGSQAVGEGILAAQGGIGTFLQAPGAYLEAALNGAPALLNRGISRLTGGAVPIDEGVQQTARDFSRAAALARKENVAAEDGTWLNPATAAARIGLGLQLDANQRIAEIEAENRARNPELVRQQQAISDAEGFIGTLGALKDNPLGFGYTLARSAPDMIAGLGIARGAAQATLREGAVAAEKAAAGVAAAGGNAAAQKAAADVVLEQAQRNAVASASAAGTAAEGASSAYNAREGVYREVMGIPQAKLETAPRYREVLAEAGGDRARAREILANELADQATFLSGASTVAGSMVTRKLFKADTTAEAVAGVKPLTARQVGRNVLEEGFEEGVQGIGEDAAQFVASSQADPSKKFDLGGTLAQNIAAGAVMGAGGTGGKYAYERARDLSQSSPSAAPTPPSGTATPATEPTAAPSAAAPTAPPPAAGASIRPTAADEEAARKLLTPVSMTALDRVPEIDTEAEQLNARLAALNDPANGYGQMFDQERAEIFARRVALQQERDSITAGWPKATLGAPTSFSTEQTGTRLAGQYALMDADELTTSHDVNLREDPRYPKELQPRDRTRAASEIQVSGIVSRLDPARLGLSADSANGAPIVGADGLVESGNARTIALKRIYQANGQKAEDYKAFLRENAAQFGITPESVDGMKKPVLVRVRQSPVNRAEFARQANVTTVQRMSPSEQALSDAKRLTTLEGLAPDDEGNFTASYDFIRQFMAMLPATEQSDMLEADGKLSTAGYRRIQNAVLAKAYGDSPTLRRMTESLDDNLRNVSKALMRVAPTIADARERMNAGTLHQADIAGDLVSAVEGLSSLKDKGWRVADELAQADLTGPKYSAEAGALLTFLSDNIRSPRRMAEFVQRYYEALAASGDPSQASMFGDAPAPTRMGLIDQARGGINAEQGDRTGAQPAAAGGQQSEGAQRGGAGAQGDAAGAAGDTRLSRAASRGAEDADWVAFPESSGTLGIPRAQMPQVKVSDRPELLQWLAGRGIANTRAEVAADTLRPTQAEFSPAKVARWGGTAEGDRSVLASSDGYILDGHHQWLAARAAGKPVSVVRFNAPIRELLDAVKAFPKVQRSPGANVIDLAQLRAAAAQDFNDALADLAAIASRNTRAALMPEDTPNLMPTLVKLFGAAIRMVGTDLKRATRWVKDQLKADPQFKKVWNRIAEETYRKAALQALEGMDAPAQGGLFDSPAAATQAVQGGLFDAVPEQPAKAADQPRTEGGRNEEGQGRQGRRQEALLTNAPALAPVPAPAQKAKNPDDALAKGAMVEWTKGDIVLRGEVVSGPDRDSNYTLRITADAGKFKAGAVVRQAAKNLRPAKEKPSRTPDMRDLGGVQVDINAPDFGLKPWPKTIQDGDPLLVSTDKKATVEIDGQSVPREVLRDTIVAQMFNQAVPVVGRKPVAYVMGGGGASGKGTIKSQLQKSGEIPDTHLDPVSGVIELDPDEIKSYIPEYAAMIEAGDSRAASVVHEESSDIAKRVLARAIGQDGTGLQYDLVYDVTLGDPKKGVALLQRLKDAGYEVRLFGVVVDPVLAVVRADGRARQTGRYVPPRDLLRAHKGFALAFEQYAGVVDRAELFENSFGARSIARKNDNGLVEVLDKNAYNQIVSKAEAINENAKTLAEASPQSWEDPNASGQVERRGDGGGREGAGSSGGRAGQDSVGRNEAPPEAEQGGLSANAQPGQSGNQGQGAGPVSATQRTGRAKSVRGGSRGADQRGSGVADAGTADAGGLGQARPDGVRGQNENGNEPEQRAGAGDDAGVPAGRDIPVKSGRNYRFGPDDLTYAGTWLQKATANVEAVELLKALEKEGRQATREEQQKLAQFIGWGASEIANSIFGDKIKKKEAAVRAWQRVLAARAEGLTRLDRRANDYWTIAQPLIEARTMRYGDDLYLADLTASKFNVSGSDVKYMELRDRLEAALTPEEFAEASRSTQYAHYTSKAIVRAMWAAMERMGFKGGTVLEPGAGIGIFQGLMPEAVAANSAYTGIEFDSVTGGILKQLMPDERILVESFVDSRLPKDFYDVAIGNPPFSGTKILGDPEYAKRAFSLHDYFFAKSIDRVKPGGLVMYVTSRYTMDKLDDKARAYLAERADLVGAIRLPQTAFQANAGTEVVTDVIFLRKKVPGKTWDGAQSWAKSVPMKVGGATFPVNEYFHAHPEMVLGSHSDTGKMQATNEPQYTVIPREGDIEAHFAAAVATLPEGIYKANRGSAAEAAQVREIDFNPKAKKEGNYYVTDAGALMVREGGVGVRVELRSAKDVELIKDFVPLRDALKQAHYDQLNDLDWRTSLTALRSAYDAFVKKHGQINQFTLRVKKTQEVDPDTGEKFVDESSVRHFTLLSKLRDDPDVTLVAALEEINDDTGAIKPSAFLSERVLGKPADARVNSPMDALLSSLNDIGKVDIDLISQRVGLTRDETIAELGTAIYDDPEAGWVMADEYLSGNVKRKLGLAREAAKSDKRYERNVLALEAAQPAPRQPSQINIGLGMNWIPGEIYANFVRELAGVRATVAWNQATKQWIVTEQSGGATLQATADWGTNSRNITELLEHGLTGRPIQITEKTGDGRTISATAAIEAANLKLEALKERFKAWVWENPKRTDMLVKLFNDQFNTTVPRSFDGRHLTLPGTSKTFDVFPHVKRGAWRIIQKGNTYLAHAVGSGKTFQMVISAMEQKRLGLIKKPMVVVPNHMLQQFAHEWQMLYPAARLMVADENNFHTDNRRRFVSRVALSDLDGVVITHSAFKLLDLDPAFKRKMIEQQLDVMRAALEQAQEEDGKGGRKSPRIKQIEQQIENMEQKLEAAMSSEGKDRNVRFDELGVDFLYVDEAHAYRKLDFITTRQVKGLSPAGSAMSFDLWMKSRYLDEKKPGRSLVMASGTPVTNTLAELYTVQKFMAPQTLEDRNISDFDSWAAMFGRERTELEPNAAGKYEPVTRFSKFVNVPELIQSFRDFADVLTADNLAALLGDARPKVEGGQRQMIVTPKTDEYKVYQRVLAERVKISKAWKPSKDQPNNPDPMIRIIGDGRLAAIDMRFVDPKAESDPDSKLNKMIDDVIRVFKETADMEFRGPDKKGTDGKKIKGSGDIEPNKGATMMVFSDLGFGAGVTESRGFNARAWFTKRLRDAGVPADQVAFMSDYKKSADKLKLFKDVNAGRVRILVGSSKNMGTGVNAQQRLKALFHLDSPWFPADLEQREGRIVRQGNKNPLVQIFAYATKGTYDENMWKMLATKQYFIDQAMSGDDNLREIEDLDSQSQFDIAAGLVAEDPRILQLAGVRAEIDKLHRLYQAHEDQRARFRAQYQMAQMVVESTERRLPEAIQAAEKAVDLAGDKFRAKALGQSFDDRTKWGESLIAALKDLTAKVETKKTKVGEISGFPVYFIGENVAGTYSGRIVLDVPSPATLVLSTEADLFSAMGLAMRAQNAVADVGRQPARMRERIVESRAQMDAVGTRLEAVFPMAGMLADKRKEAAELEAAIEADSKERDFWVERKDTRTGHTVKATSAADAIERAVKTNGGTPDDWTATDGGKPEIRLSRRGVVAAEPGAAYNVPYETDLFGNPVQAQPNGRPSAKRPGAAESRDVQPTAAVPGDTEAPAGDYYVRTVVGKIADRKLGAARILNAEDAAQATAYLYKSAVERFDAIVTDKDGKPLAVVGGFKGALTQTSVYPATVMGEAIRVPRAAKIWFSHNHPSGVAVLSRADEMLYQALADVFNGSGIEPMGVLAVAGSRYEAAFSNGDRVSGGVKAPDAAGATVPVIERNLEDGRDDAARFDRQISSPQAAKKTASKMYRGANGPGLMLLDAQNVPAAWVPLPTNTLGRLRNTGGLAALYRAISESNAGAAIIVHAGELDAPVAPGSRSISAEQNIAAALNKLDVRTLDSINVKTGKSAAEIGLPLGQGPVLSRGAASSAGGMPVKTLEALRDRIAEKMPNMPRVHVLADPGAAPKALREYIIRQDAWNDVEGAMHNGELYLFASGLSDELRAEHVLAEHEAAHVGLRAVLGDSLRTAMNLIYAQNPSIRRAVSDLQRRGNLSRVEAVEEAIVDIPTKELMASLGGWRKVVVMARDWLADHGFDRMAQKITDWLDGSMSDIHRADLFVAELVTAARDYVAGKRAGRRPDVPSDIRLSGNRLADDIREQERWLMAEARARGFKDIEDLLARNYPLFEKLAAKWREKNPADTLLSRSGPIRLPLVSAQSELDAAIREAGKALQRAIDNTRATETVLIGRSPHVLSMAIGSTMETPRRFIVEPGLLNKTVAAPGTVNTKDAGKHFGDLAGVSGEDLARAVYRPAAVVEDLAQKGNFTLVTNILTPKGPLVVNVNVNGRDADGFPAVLVNSIYARERGEIAHWINGKEYTKENKLKDARRVFHYIDSVQIGEAVTGRLNPENKNPAFMGRDLRLALGAVNTSSAVPRSALSPISNSANVPVFGSPVNEHYRGFATVQASLEKLTTGKGLKPGQKPAKNYGQLLAWIGKHYKGDESDRPMFSRAPAVKSAAERADEIISRKAGSKAPLDALSRTLTRVTGIDRLTGAIYRRAGYLLDRYTPEQIKAGVISDYGVPEAVIDQRAMMQGRQRVQLRKAGTLIDKLSTLTRAESRVAYEWMNMDGSDPKAYVSMMQGLPEESVAVLQDVQKMIDQLSQEAVALGQLDPEAFKRNRFAYLRRSYAKHVLEQTAGEKAKRQRVISILGDQYRKRGRSESATMKQLKAVAPEWWNRKLVAGQADTQLKGEKFVRLERRTIEVNGREVRYYKKHSKMVGFDTRGAMLDTGTREIDGLPAAEQRTKLREVVYIPVGAQIPSQYRDWDNAGTFEVTNVKGENVILYRDWTKDEREAMGEIDEARFAIARTLHGMIHDVEVGRYLDWLARTQAKLEGQSIPGTVVEASERYRDTFKLDEWVRVPDTKIPGTAVPKYGKLAGRYLPGPVWNDLRQVVNGQFKPLGETYAQILSMWKTAKTALSPAVHMNNVMSNFVMADWHDVGATHIAKALRILLAANEGKGAGAIAAAGRAAARAGIADREAAREILNRYKDSGGDIGAWARQEISRDQLDPLLASLEAELAATAGQSVQAQVGVMSALQHALMLRLPSAWEALKGSKVGKVVGNEAGSLIDLYQSEDDVFRLAAWLKAKEEGRDDLTAGKVSRKSFLDYHVNAPWIQAMRNTGWPFIAFTYRAVPMFLDVMGNKPHKTLKLMALAGTLNALGGLLAGGGDDERNLLPEEKAGRIWGMVPKLIRMPWNDANGSPVYLDIRRFIPVGDVLDVGQGHSAIPILPGLQPGGPLTLLGELLVNRSMFTGKSITLETDTAAEKAGKVIDYLYKAFAPNLLGLPGTYATTGVVDSISGKTDAFGREQSTAQAVASSFGVKLGSYPADVLRLNLQRKAQSEMMEIDRVIVGLKRQHQLNKIDGEELAEKVSAQQEKKAKVMKELQDKLNAR